MQLKDVLDALVSASVSRADPAVPEPDNNGVFISFTKNGIVLSARPVMHASEIQLSMEASESLDRFRQDALQRWIGIPIQSYMFREDTVGATASLVADAISTIFRKISANRSGSLRDLEASGSAISQASTQDCLREEADKAWRAARYADAVKMYRKLGTALSKTEAKRMKLAEKHASRK